MGKGLFKEGLFGYLGVLVFGFFYHNSTLQILVTAPSCSFWLPLAITTPSVYAIRVQSISLCQFSLPAPFFLIFFLYFIFSPSVKKNIEIFCDEKEGLQNMELLHSLASKQPPTTEPSEIQSGNWEGGWREEEAGTTQACRKKKVQIYLTHSNQQIQAFLVPVKPQVRTDSTSLTMAPFQPLQGDTD